MSGPRGLVLTAPSSGAGKTTLTLGLLRALSRRGWRVAAAKSGPDYIDPAFHQAACGRPSGNLDAWAMDPARLRARAGRAAAAADLLVVEGAMGALDAAADGRGSTADLAEALGLPLVLIVDAAKTGASVALPAAGLRALRPSPPLAGVVLNRVGGARHAALCRGALEDAGVTVFGAVPREAGLGLPERHLGLVQAGEQPDLAAFLDRVADRIAESVDFDQLVAAAAPLAAPGESPRAWTPLGARVAVARDDAFSFVYPHQLEDWRAAGVEIAPFSPLADEAPDADADAVFLPGGYPELHAGRLAAAERFQRGLRAAADGGARVYGECGGYMTLGRGLVDAEGRAHAMLGLLPIETSIAEPRLTLGYRRLRPIDAAAAAPAFAADLLGHEFHYARVTAADDAPALFEARDAAGAALGPIGARLGAVSGSFAHVIGPA